MAIYTSTVSWHRSESENFTDNKYSRQHEWEFDGGAVVPASSSPHIVPLPYSDEAGVDPEEAFVAALSSCHMLFFLSFAAQRGFCVDSYVDEASGLMEKNESGQMAMTRVTLKPKIGFCGEKRPTADEVDALHHKSHDACFIANSVKTEVVVE